MAFNLVVLTGRLTADAELKKAANGTSVTSFRIAVDRRAKQGEEKQADFITIVAWKQTAEFITKYFQQGSMIGIEGKIETRKYTDKDGNNRTAFEVVANNVQFVESKKAEGKPSINVEPEEEDFTEVESGDLPF